MKTLKAVKTLGKLEEMTALDPVVDIVRRAVRKVLRPSTAKDLLHGVPMGHPAHPFLVQLPTGAFACAVLLDAVPGTERAARVLIATGLAAVVPAVATGLTDWSDLHPQQQRVGLVHAGANVLATGCFAMSLAARLSAREGGKTWALAGLAALGGGGFLGGHLSFRLASGANHVEAVPHQVPAGWNHLALLEEIPEKEAQRRTLGLVPLMVWREGATVRVISDECSHLSGPLHEGTVSGSGLDACVRCPWHASEFSLATGEVLRGPATSPAALFQVRVSDGRVEVCLPGAG
ncbi:Rieske 2Fe-2S domain-containing protein [Paeniglutamicibacter antarcticus]|uniref:Rieske domain-containing protein n=1 Tax=Paeniglutamicibacter antarcticus TaxID=494023 RepID=A0ABP9TKW1_9MICC